MPNEQESARHVVVTDIRMPFWSMVIFMVKWAVAAIPALLLLATLVLAFTAVFTGVIGSVGRQAFAPSYTPSVRPSTAAAPVREVPYPANTPNRCKGSVEFDKCLAEERKLEQATPEDRAKRQRSLEGERKTNMSNVK